MNRLAFAQYLQGDEVEQVISCVTLALIDPEDLGACGPSVVTENMKVEFLL